MGKTLLEATVKETKKRRHPSKFYVYVLEVTWSEGTSTVIYRRYSDFFEFQCGLLEKFPEEAGAKDPTARSIPFLPGKKLLGRSQVRSVAEKRKDKLTDYCKALVRLPPKISDDEFVHNFFEVRMEDLDDPSQMDKGKTAKGLSSSGDIEEISGPMVLERYVALADYEKQKKNECTLTAGQMVEVIDKNQNGWWFVSLDNFNEGWVPATYLEPLYGTEDAQVEVFSPGQEQYVTTSGYHAQNPDELSFERGVIVDVCTKGLDGWWKVRYKDREGMAPAAYLNRYHGPQLDGANPTQIVGSVRDAVLQASSTVQTRPKHSWQSSARIVDEPIYAPTPRKMSVKRQVKHRAPPPVPGATATSSSSPPPSSTEPHDGPSPVYEEIGDPEEEIYVAIGDFTATNADDGLSFSAGSCVTVVIKNPSGWWYVEMGEQEGWVPSSYLERQQKASAVPSHSPTPSPSSFSAVPAPQPVKSVPMKRRELPQSSKKPQLCRSTSEESLTSKTAAPNPAPQLSKRVNSPPSNPSLLLKSGSHPQLPTQHKPSISITPIPNKPKPKVKSSSQEERSLPVKQPAKKTPVVRSASSENQLRNAPRPSQPGAQASHTNLDVRKSHVRSHSSNSREVPVKPTSRERVNTPRAGNNPVAELARALQQKQAAASSHAEPKSTGPRSISKTLSVQATTPSSHAEPKKAGPRSMTKTLSPSTTRRAEQAKKLPGRPKPYNTSATAKRGPPKRPDPPKASTMSSARKTVPVRPSNSPAQKRKMSACTVACDYDAGGDGCLALKKGQAVEVLEKNSDGWWYVKVGTKEGWAPSSFLEEGGGKPSKPERPAIGPPRPQPAQPGAGTGKPTPASRPVPKPRVRSFAPNSNTYRAAVSYQVPAYEDSGIDLVAGKIYEVKEKAEGWWFITDGQKEGWAPSSYLDPA